MICARCKKEVNPTTMSRFNTDMICLECDEIERHHPSYSTAVRIEAREVAKGNYNFKGIGLPADFSIFAAGYRVLANLSGIYGTKKKTD